MSRRFELPGIHELSKEQERARSLPENGQHLIVGGPGTGKSVVALLRVRRLKDKPYVFLVYNRLLETASQQLFGKGLKSRQWQSWFMGGYRNLAQEPVPRLPAQGNNWQDIDWPSVEARLPELPLPEAERPALIIDEGQDMPPTFYRALVNLGFENFYIVADQNQQIADGDNSSRKDIQLALGISTSEVIELRENYRNTYPVARLAQTFYTDDPASPPPELPAGRPSSRLPLLYNYPPESFERIIARILTIADHDPNRLIGIITPNNQVRERYVQALSSSPQKLDHGRPRITTYSKGADADLRFDKGGIMVINAQSCKGLEFDTVFLADINRYPYDVKDPDRCKRLFYVMAARAKNHLILLKEAGQPCPVDAILPQDPLVLERK